jgi:hypothetical protein
MVSFGYRACQALVQAEVSMQLKRAELEEEEVLNIPIILGGVGLGKTSIARYIASQLAYRLIKINCGECGDPTDISGLPVPWRIKDEQGQEPHMEWVLNRAMHIACTEAVVLFFDDIDKAPALVEGALLSVFGERTARDRKLHPGTVVLAAGNRVEDDALARRLSESLRTRGTVINLEPRLADFASYAKKTTNRVHPAVLGFLSYRPALLHKHDPDADRFPTPRSWVEASSYLFEYDEDADLAKDKSNSAWKTCIALKCGEAASNEFYAWWSICSKINVKKLLLTGEIEHNLSAAEDLAIVDYAAVFAVAQELNGKNGPKREYVGLAKYLQDLHAEHRVALLTQLTASARKRIADLLPSTADIIMSAIVPVEG